MSTLLVREYAPPVRTKAEMASVATMTNAPETVFISCTSVGPVMHIPLYPSNVEFIVYIIDGKGPNSVH